MRVKNNNAGFVGASFVIALAILTGSILLLRNRENVATFYPSDCVGSWKYADRAEGEIQEPTKNSEIASYSAILSNSSGDIYCGNFTGEIPAEKIPETFSIGLSLRAFPEGKIKDTGPTEEEKEEGKNESDIEKEIEKGLSPSVDDILEGGGNINEIPEKVVEETTEENVEEDVVDTNTEETIEETTPPTPDPTPEEPAPEPEPEPVVEETPVSDPEPEPIVSFWQKIIKVARAEEAPVDPAPEPEPDPVVVEEPAPDPEPEPIIEETTTPDPVVEETTEPDTTPEEVVDDTTDTVDVVDDTGGEETQSKKEIRKEEKAVKKEDKQKARIIKRGEDTSTPYLKVFLSLDGYNWQEIGVVTYNTLPNPIFEVDKSLIKKWENIDNIQIRIVPIANIDNNLEFFLDGMFVDVAYDTLAPIYDAPEVFIKDPQDIVQADGDFTLNQNPSFIISEPLITVDEAKDLISKRQADVLEDKHGVLGDVVISPEEEDEESVFNQTVEQKKQQIIIKAKNAIDKNAPDETETLEESQGATTQPTTTQDADEQISTTPPTPDPTPEEPAPEPEPEPVVEETPVSDPEPEPIVSFWQKIIKVARAEEAPVDPAPEPEPDPVVVEEPAPDPEPEPIIEETTTPDPVVEETTEPDTTPEEVVDDTTDTVDVVDDTGGEEVVDTGEDVYVPETIQLESPLNYLLNQDEDVIFLEDIEKPEGIYITIFDPYGDIVDLPYTFKKVLYEGIEKTQIVIDKSKRDFKPGRYTIEVSVDTPQAKVTTQQDFSWGVLAVNFDRSVYSPGMTSYIQMGVLDDGGRTVCDADLTMYVTDPDGNISTLSTDDGSITREEECGPDNIISVPDYYAYFDTTIEGEYKTTLSAVTANGQKTVKDSFMVDEGVVFDVERIAPTRINPKAEYSVMLKVTATEDWSGTVIERVPLSFEIRKGSQGIPYNNIIENLGEKEIRWSLSLTAGETATISYRFKAPLISPELFLIGPLSFRFGEEIFFEEGRYWQIASDAVANNGVMYYGDTNASSQGVLRARVFTNPSTFATEINGATSNTSFIQWVIADTSPVREEIIIGSLKVDGSLYVETCTTGCDANGDYTAQWNNPGTSATQTCNTPGTGSFCLRTFDLAYESLSGRGMVVYSDNVADKVYYALWDGSSWSPDSSPGTPSATNEIDLPGSAGVIWGIRLVPSGYNLASQRSDRMMLLVIDANRDLFAYYWDGSSWDSGTTIETLMAVACQFAMCFDGNWQFTDNFVLSYADSTTGAIKYRTYNVDTGWSGESTAYSTNSNGQWVVSKADPTSSRVLVTTSAQGNDTRSAVWRGDDTTDGWTVCAVTDCPDTATEKVVSMQAYTAFERFNGEGLHLYNDAGSTTTNHYFTFTPSGTWGSKTRTGITTSDDALNVKAWGSPNADDIMIAVSDVDCDLYAQLWTGAGLSTANADLETNLTNYGVACPNNNAPGTDPAGASYPYDFAWKFYSPWGRNWRFYSDYTSNTPSTGIAAENATATGVAAEDYIRLRYQFVETGSLDGADLRKKLQWTTDDPDSLTATWTDVGDTGETSAVWRYATSGETCGSCSDNTAIATSNLTGSTETGAYISDKDATAGSNMDNTGLAITEYDYPLKAENVTSATYYFRAYDVDMVTPVWRYQASGTTDCLSSTCSYPSVTISAGSGVSGTVYKSDESTAATTGNGGDCDGTTANVSLRVNGGTAQTTTCSSSDGTYTFSSVTVSAGDTISIYTTGTNKANLVYVSSGSGDVGMDLYYDTVVVGHKNAGPATILDLVDYDSTTDDTNMLYDAVDSSPDTLTVEDGVELHILDGSTFTPGGTVTTSPSSSSSSKDGDIHIDGTGTLSMGTNALSVGGDFTNEGTFSYSSSQTTTFTATATGHVITDGGENFDNVTFNGSGGGWALADSSTFDSTLTLTAGTFTPSFDLTVADLDIGASGTITLGSITLTLTGTDGTPLTNSGTFNEGTSTVIYNGNNGGGNTSIASSVNYYNLSVSNASENYVLTGTTTVNAAGTTNVLNGTLSTGSDYTLSTGKLEITNAGSAIFVANASTIYLTATSGTVFTRGASATFSAGTSSVELTGAGDVFVTDSNITGFYDLVINGTGTKTLVASNTGITHNFTVSAGTVDPDGNAITGSGTNTLTVNAATIKVDQSGPGALDSNYSSFETVTLNTDSTVDFDANVNQGLSTHTYYNVLISSAGGTKALEQSTTINGTLTMQGGSGFNTFDDTYDLNVGSIDIQAGTFTSNGSTITIAGDFSNAGTFSADTSSVIFNGANTATITGTTSFYDLTLTHTAAKEVDFSVTGGAIYTVSHTFTVTGSSGNLITIRSTSGGTKFQFNPTGTASVDYADVQDGGCEGTAIQMSPTNSTNSGNNDSCWFDASLTFSISDTTIGFGPLTILNARWATGDLSGSSSDTAAHTFSIQTSAASGYSLTYFGDLLKSGTDDIDAASITNDADGDPGVTEAFGLGLSTDGSSTIASGYDHNATPASRDWSWVANTITEIVSKTSPVSSTETISAYYLANISSLTEAGSYSTDVTYIITGNF